MNNLLEKINEPVFFVTNDVWRGIGLETLAPNYHVVCLDDHPMVDLLVKQKVSVFCLERVLGQKNVLPRNSGEILKHPGTQEFIKDKAGGQQPNILFFKPQKKLEIVAGEKSYRLLGNSADSNGYFEDKLSFFLFCRENNFPVPKGEIINWQAADYPVLRKKYGETLVIQFGQGWAGNSTFFVSSEKQLEILKKKLVRSKVKISSFVTGVTCINNAVVYGSRVFQSKPAVQIKSMGLISATQAGTGGRQWPAEVANDTERKIKELTEKIGIMMARTGYKGYFGLDFIVEDNGRVYLSECNARQTASVPFYTKLEIEKDVFPLLGYHLLAFLPRPINKSDNYEAPDISGGELVVRNTTSNPVIVRNGLEPGMYDQNLNLLSKSAYLEAGKIGEFFLSTAGKARKVNPEIELFRIDTYDKLCDEKGDLLPQYIKKISEIREKLRLK